MHSWKNAQTAQTLFFRLARLCFAGGQASTAFFTFCSKNLIFRLVICVCIPVFVYVLVFVFVFVQKKMSRQGGSS